MSVSKNLYGTPYLIPETKDTGWGPTVTAVLLSEMTGLDGLSTLIGSVPALKVPRATTSLSAGATLTQTNPHHIVSGNGGPVVLSAVTAIADAAIADTLLILTGGDGTNTVTIRDGANTKLNGDVILGLEDSITLCWNGSDWEEINRSS